MRTFLLALATLTLSGCTSLNPISAEKIAALPILEIGQTVPADKEYILHIAAGKSIPIKFEVVGDAVVHPAFSTTVVQSREDIFLYKQWTSLDGKTWQLNHQLFKNTFSIGLDPSGGTATLRIDKVSR